MPNSPYPRLRRHLSSGIVQVRIKTPRGMQWLSTGQTSYQAARDVCDQARINELQVAACANLLTGDVIGRLLIGKRFTCSGILEAWAEDVRESMAPETFSGYQTTLLAWLEAIEAGDLPLTGIQKPMISGWVNARRITFRTRQSRLGAIRSFYGFAAVAGYCVGDLSQRVRVRTDDLLFSEMEPKEILPFTETEFRTLMASQRISADWRHATALAYWLGLRLRDVACLEWDSIREAEVIIYPKKTGRRLALPLDDPLLGGGELRGVLAEMTIARVPGEPFCFPVMRATVLDTVKRAKLSVQFGRILRQHKIADRRFHSCRHAAAVRLRTAGKTLEEIGRVLGHASEGVTKRYAEHGEKAVDG